MGLEFQIQEDKVCYTLLKDKCDAIQNLESPKTLRQTRAFCGMVNFLSSFLPNLRRLLIPIYDLQKKAKKFKWTEEAERVFNDIKKLLINPPVLKAPTPDENENDKDENLYAHKTKTLDTTPVKQKHGRPPKPKLQILSSNPRTSTVAKSLTARPRQYPRSLSNEIVSRQMIDEINAEWEKSDRLTVAKLNAVKQFNKQDHKSKLMTEKYSLLPLNPQQLTPVQTAIQRMSDKHRDFEI